MLNAMLKLINQQKQKSKKGFTLVELIVVIAILGILAALVVPSVSGYIKKAQDATNESNAQMLYSAAQLYVTDKEAGGTAIADGTAINVDDLYTEGYLQKKFDQTKLGTVTIRVASSKTSTGTDGSTSKTEYLKSRIELTYKAKTGSALTYNLGTDSEVK